MYFISFHSIVQRLDIGTPLLNACIPDWRAILNVVLIDGAYDGEVFNITLSDVPERKDDLVAGRNEFPHQANYVTFQFFSLDL
ncbi:MAG TPA: hypothetical protein VFZ76_14415 [Anaerolineales bacterium]